MSNLPGSADRLLTGLFSPSSCVESRFIAGHPLVHVLFGVAGIVHNIGVGFHVVGA